MIGRGVERLQTSVQSLLKYVKGEPALWTIGSVNKTIDRICDFLQEECKKRSIQLDKREQSQIPDIRMQPELLEEALLNLAVNGMEATRRGGTLSLQTETTADAKWVRVRISDQGRGMSPRQLKSPKTTFVTTKKNRMGSGPVFARKILQQHRAKVQIESQREKGTNVAIIFPVSKLARPEDNAAEHHAQSVEGKPQITPHPAEAREWLRSFVQFFH